MACCDVWLMGMVCLVGSPMLHRFEKSTQLDLSHALPVQIHLLCLAPL